MTRPLLGLCIACLAGCSGQTYSDAPLADYVGTWAYTTSQINVSCSDGTSQTVDGSGQIDIMVASDDATDLAVTQTGSCPQAEVMPQGSGYTLEASVMCGQSTLTALHIAVDAHELTTLLFSSSAETMVSGATCTRTESGTATRNP